MHRYLLLSDRSGVRTRVLASNNGCGETTWHGIVGCGKGVHSVRTEPCRSWKRKMRPGLLISHSKSVSEKHMKRLRRTMSCIAKLGVEWDKEAGGWHSFFGFSFPDQFNDPVARLRTHSIAAVFVSPPPAMSIHSNQFPSSAGIKKTPSARNTNEPRFPITVLLSKRAPSSNAAAHVLLLPVAKEDKKLALHSIPPTPAD